MLQDLADEPSNMRLLTSEINSDLTLMAQDSSDQLKKLALVLQNKNEMNYETLREHCLAQSKEL